MTELFRCALPEVNTREVLRYMGCKDADAEIATMLADVLDECRGVFDRSAVCYTEVAVEYENERLLIGGCSVESGDLKKALGECQRALLFGATVGVGIDRLIARYSRVSPSRALCLQALGAERIEALCDAFCDEYAKKAERVGERLRPRFSAGYGDLSLAVQKDWFRILDCHKKIGLSLNESLMMSPAKSVTAIAGIEKLKV